VKNFWIFGDSFSAPWHIGEDPFPDFQQYIEQEKLDGNSIIQDLEYWLGVLSNKKFNFINTARGGMSNDTIFDRAYKAYPKIKSGDYVLLQLSQNTRVQTIQSSLTDWYDVFFSENNSREYIKEVNNVTLLGYENLEKIALQRSTDLHLRKILIQAQMFVSAVQKSNAKICFTSLDRLGSEYSMIPGLYWDISIFNPIEIKYPHIKDRHPTFEGHKNIAKKILTSLEDNFL